MSPLPSRRVARTVLAAVRRLRGALWPIAQTSVAAGLAWYLTHDVLNHRDPFFAPISAVVCLSATNVLRGQRAVQMIIGVALGIALGSAVLDVVGLGSIAIAVAVLVALSVAVFIGRGFIGQGLMFVNQTAVSAVLVLVFAHSALVTERLFDVLVGGGLAIVFGILLFPANPVIVLRDARGSVLTALHDTLAEVAGMIGGSTPVAPDWPLSAVDQLHQQVAGLAQARNTAHLVVRAAPRRWSARDTVDSADRQAAQLGLLASSVLHLARVVTPVLDHRLPQPMHGAVAELAAGAQLADADPVAAARHAAIACDDASALHAAARNRTEVVLADVVQSCADDLQEVIDLALAPVRAARPGTP